MGEDIDPQKDSKERIENVDVDEKESSTEKNKSSVEETNKNSNSAVIDSLDDSSANLVETPSQVEEKLDENETTCNQASTKSHENDDESVIEDSKSAKDDNETNKISGIFTSDADGTESDVEE